MISKIILGTAQFGLNYGINNTQGKPSYSEIKKILDYAFSSGIWLLDTAEAYGNSHQIIGDYHKNSNNRFGIITKINFADESRDLNLANRVNENLRQLAVDSLYCYLFHSLSDLKQYYQKYENDFNKLIFKKKVKKIGVSVYSNTELEEAMNYNLVSLIQLPFNLFDNIKQRGYGLLKAKQRNIEIHTRSVFLQGLFFKDIATLNSRFWSLSEHLAIIKKLAFNSKLDIARLALGYVLSQKNIDGVLIGVDNLRQLEQNIDNVKTNLPLDLIEKINKIDVKESDLLNPSNWK